MVAANLKQGAETVSVTPMRAWLSIGILLLMTIISYMDRGIIGLMVDPIKQDLGISDLQIGLLQGVAFVSFYAIISVPMGWLVDRFSRRSIIFLGVNGWSLATVACGLSRSYAQLFGARMAVGAGEAVLSPAAYAIVAEIFPRKRLSTAIGVLAAGTAIGGGIAFAAGGLIVDAAAEWNVWNLRPWQIAFICAGLPGLLLAPAVYLIPRVADLRPNAMDSAASSDGYWDWLKLRKRYFFGLSFGAAFHTAMSYGLSSWTPVFVAREYGWSASDIGLTLAPVTSISNIIGFIGGGWLVDRMHASGMKDAHIRFFVFNCVFITLFGVAAFAVSNSMMTLIPLLIAINILLPFTGPVVGHLQLSTPARFRGRTIAIYMLILNFVGMGLGPTSVALFSEKLLGGSQHLGMGLALMFAVLGPMSIALFIWTRRAARRAIENA